MSLDKVLTAWKRGVTRDFDELVEDARAAAQRAQTGQANHAIAPLALQIVKAAIVVPERVATELAVIASLVDRAVAEEDRSLTRETFPAPAVLGLMNLVNAFESVGAPIASTTTETIRRWLPRMVADRNDAQAFWYWSTAFAALALDEHAALRRLAGLDSGALAPFVPGQAFQFNLRGMLVHLAGAIEQHATLASVSPAWQDALANLDRLLEAKSVDPGTVLWIARIVYHRIGNEPVGVVARRLHDAMSGLAGVV